VWAMDVARFGEFATHDYGLKKSAENYSRRFIITYPNEELPAARPLKTTALYEVLAARGAVFGSSYGLEHALWFSPGTIGELETPTFRRSNAFAHVARECRNVREAVGAIEIANYAKHAFSGVGARAFLDRLLAGKIPAPGRLALTPMLSPSGKLQGDLTVACLDAETYYVFGSNAAQNMHRRWFEQHLPESGVSYRNATDDLQGIALAGPRSRELLQRLTTVDVSGDALRFKDFRRLEAGGVPLLLARLSFTGELGYELYCAPQYQHALFSAIETAGRDLGLGLFGNRALLSLRLEKGWGVWTRDFRPDFTVGESGLDKYIHWDKEAFIGMQAALAEREAGARKRLIVLDVDADDVDAAADEPIFADGSCIGYVTSGGFAHTVGRSIAFGYVPVEHAAGGTQVRVEILGDMRPAIVLEQPLVDPAGARMRG